MKLDSSLKKLQNSQLLILKEIKRICEKENIEYSLAGGTLLGAYRHGGFIPWDDDIDIYMTIDNFTRFEKIANKELKSNFFYQTPNTDLECKSFQCGRVRLEGTYFESNSLPNNWKHNGVFVDILPLIKVSESKIAQKIFFYKFNVIVRIVWLKNNYKPNPKNIFFKLIMKLSYLITFFIPSSIFEKFLSTYHLKYKKLSTYKYIDLLASNFDSSLIDSDIPEEYTFHKFEDDEYSVFKKSEQLLSSQYGNWRELPPVEERKPHHILNIDFNQKF